MHGVQRRSDRDALDVDTAERLSKRLRMARHLRGMTLKALADAAGCSESLLSKIENGKAYPSLPMLNRLSQALDSSIGWLFETREAAEAVVSRAEARQPVALVGAPAVALEAVVPSLGDGMMRCDILHMDAGATRGGERAAAGQEVGYLLGGEIELVVGGRVHALKAGDAFAFRSDQPHSLRNVGTERARLFWVVTPLPA